MMTSEPLLSDNRTELSDRAANRPSQEAPLVLVREGGEGAGLALQTT